MSRAGKRRVAVPGGPLGVGAGLLLLLGLVALSTRGHGALGGGVTHTAASRVFFDYAFTIFLIAMCLGVLLLVYVYAAGAKQPGARGQKRRSWPTLLLVLLLVGGAFARRRIFGKSFGFGGQHGAAGKQGAVRQHAGHALRHPAAPHLKWLPILLVLGVGLAAIAWLFYRLAKRHRAAVVEQMTAEQALAQVLDDTLDDLRREPDVRKAIIAAYARMGRALALHGLPRHEAEAPHEYLSRVLAQLSASNASVARLTGLFERAKFGGHALAPPLKDEAIDALVAVRDELRAEKGEPGVRAA